MANGFIIKCIDSVVKTILNAEEEIEHLDRAIGDGDHYINIKRGSIAVQSIKSELTTLTTRSSFQKNRYDTNGLCRGCIGPFIC
jgi:dihydroxyacetone kinase-like protein